MLFKNYFLYLSSKKKSTELIENVRSEFKTTLNQTDWIDEQTMAIALNKLNKMKIMVGYPDEILNETHIIDYYSGV